jgi:predicted KAP-like P-loop ATPase
MKLVTPAILVENMDSFKNDLLDRKGYGENLRNLIARTHDELVISLHGKWGEGKTTFVKMWQGLLNESNIPNLYIDAFSIDYVDDAFISIVSEITSYAESNINKEFKESLIEFKDKAVKIGGHLLSWSAKIAVKAATLGIIKNSDLEELNEIKDVLSTDASGIVSKFVEERISSHSKNVALIQSFKELLSILPSKLDKTDNKPLVIIIDELDRCRPNFAVEVLEKIKHLFSVKNIVFVLVMNKYQLEESIKNIYGQDIVTCPHLLYHC